MCTRPTLRPQSSRACNLKLSPWLQLDAFVLPYEGMPDQFAAYDVDTIAGIYQPEAIVATDAATNFRELVLGACCSLGCVEYKLASG